jgi:hypothetical protein
MTEKVFLHLNTNTTTLTATTTTTTTTTSSNNNNRDVKGSALIFGIPGVCLLLEEVLA